MPLVIAYHLIWTACGWWLPNDPRDENPVNIGLPKKDWPFVVTPYDGWPLYPGHNASSPYARSLCNTRPAVAR
jgi:hypothetical protein